MTRTESADASIARSASRRRKALPWLICVAVGGLLLAAVWVLEGPLLVQKLLTQAALPVGLLWLALLAAMLAGAQRRDRRLVLWAAAPCLLLMAAGNGWVANSLAADLEAEYLPLNPLADGTSFDALVVLGGGSYIGANGNVQLIQSGDRVALAARLYHAGQAPIIYCSGRNTFDEDSAAATDPAVQSAGLLRELGVPQKAIRQIGGRTTSEEMQALAALPLENLRVGLVTSAWHMRRALRLARRQGLDLQPAPADFAAVPPSAASWRLSSCLMQIVPTVDALAVTSKVVREQLALLVGR